MKKSLIAAAFLSLFVAACGGEAPAQQAASEPTVVEAAASAVDAAASETVAAASEAQAAVASAADAAASEAGAAVDAAASATGAAVDAAASATEKRRYHFTFRRRCIYNVRCVRYKYFKSYTEHFCNG